MSRGTIRRRGKRSWEVKFDVPSSDGTRKTRYVTVKGLRQDAQRELTRLLGQNDAGSLPAVDTRTIAEHLRSWLDGPNDLSRKTLERYRELAERQIVPHLGAYRLQRLSVQAVRDWQAEVAKPDDKGRALSARTIGHAHRVLHRALALAVENEVLSRNVASVVGPPKTTARDIAILTADEVALVLEKLRGHPLGPIVTVAITTGLRRGEILALQLGDVDLEAATLRVERSLEETKEGLRFKPPKSAAGRRVVALPADTVAVLRDVRRKLLEARMALGLGKPDGTTLLFGNPWDGSPRKPSNLTTAWRWACKALDLPRISFHSLRHCHASLLIAGGIDVVQASKRLGHSKASTTLDVYAKMLERTDRAAAMVIENMLRTPRER
jgi:integrase